jgi:hypothetical protein
MNLFVTRKVHVTRTSEEEFCVGVKQLANAMEKTLIPATDGVFPAALDQCAFIDTLKLSIWGTRRESPLCAVRDVKKERIGSRRTKYGWVERGIVEDTGNRYEVVYGPRRLRKILPPLEIILRSDQSPVRVADAVAAISNFCDTVTRVMVSYAEFTFDLTGRSVAWFEQCVFSSARRFVTLTDEDGRRTLYVGGVTSPWELRVYEKTPNVTRFEFILRRRFLRQRSISLPENLKLLRHLDFGSCVTLQRPNSYAVEAIRKNLGAERGRAFDSISRMLPLREFVGAAERIFRAPRRDLVLPDPLDEQLGRMRRQMIC